MFVGVAFLVRYFYNPLGTQLGSLYKDTSYVNIGDYLTCIHLHTVEMIKQFADDDVSCHSLSFHGDGVYFGSYCCVIQWNVVTDAVLMLEGYPGLLTCFDLARLHMHSTPDTGVSQLDFYLQMMPSNSWAMIPAKT